MDPNQVDPSSLALNPQVTTPFLQSCQTVMWSLHRVAEFSFVLLLDVPHSVEKQRCLKLANDLSAYSSFIRSVFEADSHQDPTAAVRRLADIKMWARRALRTVLYSVHKLRD